MSPSTDVSASGIRVADLLHKRRVRLVLAESCTGGLIAATLAQIPGISDHLCGSAVVYRSATKTAWLGIEPALLEDPAVGPVSAEVTRALAIAVLERTPEADLSAAVTGHLGPNAPPELDGVVHVAVAMRTDLEVSEQHAILEAIGDSPAEARCRRQWAAAMIVLDAVAAVLNAPDR